MKLESYEAKIGLKHWGIEMNKIGSMLFAATIISFCMIATAEPECPNGNTQTSFEILSREDAGTRLRLRSQIIGPDGQPLGPETSNEIVDNDNYLLSHLVLDQIINDDNITEQEFSQYLTLFKSSISGYHNYAQANILPQIRNWEDEASARMDAATTDLARAEAERERDRMREVYGRLIIFGPLGTISNVNDFITGGMYDRREFTAARLQRTARQLKEQLVELDGIYQEYWNDGHNYVSAIEGNPGDAVDAENYIQSGNCRSITLNQESLGIIADPTAGTQLPDQDGIVPGETEPLPAPLQEAINAGGGQET